jgi:hypothetical protein
MSETTSDHANQYYPPFLGLPHGCDRVVKWVAIWNTMGNRLNYAEASGMSEDDVAAIHEEELEALYEIEALVERITGMHAVDDVEIDWKKQVVNALTSIPAWDRDSLHAMWRSIMRDQLEVITRPYPASATRAQRGGWFRSRLSIVKG